MSTYQALRRRVITRGLLPAILLATAANIGLAASGDAAAGHHHHHSHGHASAEPRRNEDAERSGALARSTTIEQQVFGEHIGGDALPPSQIPPHQPSLADPNLGDYNLLRTRENLLDRPSVRDELDQDKPRADMVRSTCDPASFGSLSGSALVSAVRAAPVSCINGMFALSGSTAYSTFREAQMVTIANALQSQSVVYDGTNAGGILQLVLYLRAGYYVQFYDSAVGSYGANLRNAIRPALDAFANNSRFGLVNNVHGEVLAEYVTLIDSSSENARYLYSVGRRLLNAYGSGHNAHHWMKVAVNNVFLITFRGHQNADFRNLIQSDPSIIDVLYNFANNHFHLLGQDDDYLVANAGRELARFLQYDGNVKSLARSRARTLVQRSSITGSTARMWISIGEMVDFYDRSNCAYYDMCNFAERVRSAVLPINHTCSARLRIVAQQMTSAQLSWTCNQIAGLDNYFHDRLQTGRVPVADDYNTSLEMVVFDSSSDYRTYAGAIYGIPTNNGGMYLEGNPANPSNQARFIAHEAEWLLPTFEIWNLHHEYIHYVDGRYNLYGNFSQSISQRTVWWIEGLAEYLAFSYRNLVNTSARNQAALGTFALSTIYQNDYNSSSTRIYAWGYLAVRFMFEHRRAQVDQILARLRPGNYTGYASYMNNTIGSSNNNAFAAWLPCVANPSSSGCGGGDTTPPTTPGNLGATASGSNQINLSWTASTDSGGSGLAGYRIERCQGSSCTNFSQIATTTSISFANTGLAASTTYRYRVRAYDGAGNQSGYSNIATATTTSSGGGSSALQNGVPVTGLSASTGNALYFTLDVPAGATELRFQISGGSGDADLYVRFGQQPTTTTYDCRPYLSGNNETCTIGTAQAGRYHVMVRAYSTFSGVSLTGSFTAGGTNLPECSGADPRQLDRNCRRSNISATTGNVHYMFIFMPSGVSELRIRSSGGSGNANLYASLTSWATPSNYHYRSINAGNSESINIPNPPSGWLYISLHAASSFSGVQVSTEY